MTKTAYMRAALKETFSRPEGWIAFVAGFVFVALLAMILSNVKLLGFIFHERTFSTGFKVTSALQTIWGGRVTFRHEGGYVTLILAFLFGLNAALIERYMQRQVQLHHAAGASVIGIVVGLLGVGCAACGSAVLSSLLGAGAAVGGVAFLPYHGREFSWIGIVLVIVSMFGLARKIVEPEACAIPEKNVV